MTEEINNITIAEDLRPDEIKTVFEKNKIWDKIIQPLNHIIIGSRGSGKSILLKKLSASLMDSVDFPNNYNIFGVYIHISHITRVFNAIFYSIQRALNDDTVLWNKRFNLVRETYAQYISLHLMRRFCEEIEVSSQYDFYSWNNSDKKKRIINSIGNLIDLKEANEAQEIIKMINDQIRQIDAFLSGDWLTINELPFRYKLNIFTLPETLSKIIIDNTNADNKMMDVYYLLDNSEYIHPECQKVCNSFFERGFSFKTKLAVRPYHLDTLETLSGKKIRQGTEFRILFLDHIYNDKENNTKFILKILDNYIGLIRKNYSKYHTILSLIEDYLKKYGQNIQEIISIFAISCTRDFINFFITLLEILEKEQEKIYNEETILFQIKTTFKKIAKIQFEQLRQIEPLDKVVTDDSYPWERIRGLYSFITNTFKNLHKENKIMDNLTFNINDLFIPEELQYHLKPAFAEGIFRFYSEDDSFLLSIPNKFYLDPLFLHAPQIDRYKLYQKGKREYILNISIKEIKKFFKSYIPAVKVEKKEIPKNFSAFLSCSFEETPLTKENRDSIKKSLKSVKIDAVDAEECGITFLTTGIRDKIASCDLFLLELSKLSPNIMFEFGIAASFEKFTIPMVNKESESGLKDAISKLELPITIYEYSFEKNVLEEKTEQIRMLANSIFNSRGKLCEPSFQKTDVRNLKSSPKKNMIYISYPIEHKSLWEKALNDLSDKFTDYSIITDDNSGLTSIEATKYQVPIYCIAQSKFCIIDTSGKETPDLFQSYILGLSFGLGKNTIRIEERGLAKKEKISLWTSYPYTSWSDIKSLTYEILKFIKIKK